MSSNYRDRGFEVATEESQAPCAAQGLLLDFDAGTLTVWVNGEWKGVAVHPGMTVPAGLEWRGVENGNGPRDVWAGAVRLELSTRQRSEQHSVRIPAGFQAWVARVAGQLCVLFQPDPKLGSCPLARVLWDQAIRGPW